MSHISKEELQNLAHLSALHLDKTEIDLFADQIETILTYVDQLAQADMTQEVETIKNINVFREDAIKKFDSETILSQAPDIDGRYFVVPKVLNEK